MKATPLAKTLAIAPLTREAFAPFGDVVEIADRPALTINQGFADRFNGLAKIDVSDAGGAAQVSIFRARQRPQPIAIELMERHPLGSQLFYPLQNEIWLVLVCSDPRAHDSYRAYLANGTQGVNYAKNTWHHPLLVLHDNAQFMIVDRAGPGDNLEEYWLDQNDWLHLSP
jgi:ureidoglycolate lyase